MSKLKKNQTPANPQTCKAYFYYCNIKSIVMKINGLFIKSNQYNRYWGNGIVNNACISPASACSSSKGKKLEVVLLMGISGEFFTLLLSVDLPIEHVITCFFFFHIRLFLETLLP